MAELTQLLINSLIAAAIYSLIALGFNLIYGVTKFVNMAHGAMAVVGGYTVFFLTRIYSINVFGAVVIGVAAAGLCGVLTDILVFSPLRKRKASNLVSFLASLGIFTVIQAVIAIAFTSDYRVLSQDGGEPVVYAVGNAFISQVQVIIVIAAVVLFLALLALLRFTKFGKTVRAIQDDAEVAGIIGINTNKIIRWIFFIGSAFAGLSGILIGFDTGMNPAMGLLILLEGATSSIMGGLGSVAGSVVGSGLLGAAENFGIWKVAAEWKGAIAFGILILFLIFRPQGIINRNSKS